MSSKRKLFYLALVVVIFIFWFVVFKYNSNKKSSIVTMSCYDYPDNLSGKHGFSFPCKSDDECDLLNESITTKMKEFCNPAEVNFMKCGSKDFCGDDGFCKHDCSLDAQ